MLHLLMPDNSVQDCALKLADFKQVENETISDYALRWRKMHQRLEAAMGRAGKGSHPLDCHVRYVMAAWPKPSTQVRQSDKPATSFQDAVDRARMHDGSKLAGSTVNAVSYTRTPTAR